MFIVDGLCRLNALIITGSNELAQIKICGFLCWHLYGTLLAPIFCSGAAPSKGSIWDEFSELNQHEGILKI